MTLVRATAYTFWMSHRAMLDRTQGGCDESLLWYVKRWAVGLSELAGIEVVATGVDAIDWSKPCVIMANHESYLDIHALYRVLPRPFGFIAKKSLFHLPFFGGVMRGLGCVPVNRQHHKEALGSMQEAARIVRSGTTIAVFPEGTRGPGDRILPLKKGSFHLVQAAQVPAVPIGIRGTHALMPRQNTAMRGGRVEVHVGPPIAPPAPDDASAREAMITEVRRELARLARLPLREA